MKRFKKSLTVLLGLIILINIYTLASKIIFKNNLPTILGYSNAIVASDSMYPTFKTGDLLFFKKQANYKKEDIIIFEEDKSFVTHRIVADKDSGFITKGDNNKSNDKEIVKSKNIKGKLVFRIIGAGSFIRFFGSLKGIAVILLICLALEYRKFLDTNKNSRIHRSNRKNVRNKINMETKKNNVVIVGGVILLATIITPTFSRYVAKINVIDKARVAKVYMDGNLNELTTQFESFYPGEVRTFDFELVNYKEDHISEINQDYTITLETTGNLPLEYELVVLDKKRYQYADDFEVEGSKLVAKNGYMGCQKEENHTYQLRVTAGPKTYDTYYMNEIDAVKLKIDSVQKRD